MRGADSKKRLLFLGSFFVSEVPNELDTEAEFSHHCGVDVFETGDANFIYTFNSGERIVP